MIISICAVMTHCLTPKTAKASFLNMGRTVLQEAGTNFKNTLDTQWGLANDPLSTYLPEIPPLSSLEMRLDGLIAFGPCRYDHY